MDKEKTGNYIREYKHTSEKKSRLRRRYSLTRNSKPEPDRAVVAPYLVFNIRFY